MKNKKDWKHSSLDSKIGTGFKQTEIGKIPRDWDLRAITELISHVVDNRGRSAPTARIGIPLIATNCIEEHGLFPVKEKIRYVSKKTYRTWFRDHPKPGDIIIVNKGTPGSVCFVPNPVDFCIAQDMIAIRPDQSQVYSKYLFAAMRSKRFKYQVDSLNVGTTIPHLKKTVFSQLMIPIPTREEQIFIGDLYYLLSKKIELNLKMNSTLETIGQALFKHWFIDLEFPNENGEPYKSSGGEMVFNDELDKEIPKGWKIRTLREICNNSDSKRIPLSKRERIKRRGRYPYYGATSIMDFVNDYIFDGRYVLMAEDGSVVDDYGHPILQYVWDKFWANNHTHILQGKGLSTEFLYLLLRKTYVRHIVTGAVQPKINQTNMNTLRFAIPNNRILNDFERIIQPIFSMYRKNDEEKARLSRIRDILLSRFMSGKIRPITEEVGHE
jgi:type I restriction enzyme S subunit